jgi:hypothetical protein
VAEDTTPFFHLFTLVVPPTVANTCDYHMVYIILLSIIIYLAATASFEALHCVSKIRIKRTCQIGHTHTRKESRLREARGAPIFLLFIGIGSRHRSIDTAVVLYTIGLWKLRAAVKATATNIHLVCLQQG